ncbi:MAG: DUF1559 domain-containing protein [Pirellulaceae bacterium]
MGKGGVKFRDIIDGTTNTLMVVVAGPDKAQPWTKPGGLQWREGAASQSLGQISDKFGALFCDGSRVLIDADINAEDFRRMVDRDDQERFEDSSFRPENRRKTPRGFSFVLRSASDLNGQKLLASIGRSEVTDWSKVGHVDVATQREYSVAMIDSKTIVGGPEDLVPRMLATQVAKQTMVALRLKANAGDLDLFALADARQLQVLRQKIARGNPINGFIASVEAVEIKMDVSRSEPDFLIARVVMSSAEAAEQFNSLAVGVTQMQKSQLMLAAQNPNSRINPKVFKPLIELVSSLSISLDGRIVTLRLPKPTDMDTFLQQLQPALALGGEMLEQLRARQAQMQLMNGLKQIALAMHNCHDAYHRFPRHNGDAMGRQTGLSWRVHLLPYLEQLPLYNQFNLDEPWDSAHNKPLIDKMPKLFAVEGVDKPGYTSIHVFTGDKTPFPNVERGMSFRDILDGTSNTIMAVRAGPGTAQPWTKPGGLEFDGENAVELLGDVGDSLLFSLMDGSVHYLKLDQIADQLPLMIMHQDGTSVRLPNR